MILRRTLFGKRTLLTGGALPFTGAFEQEILCVTCC